MRRDEIGNRLTNSFAGVGLTTVKMSKEEWDRFGPEPRWRFGWVPPLATGTSGLVVVCPELIDRITAELDDDDLDSYLLVIEAWVICTQQYPGRSADEIDGIVQSELYDNARFALRLWSTTDAKALDSGVVPAGC